MSQPIVTVQMAVEFEVQYNPFSGKTPEEFANTLQDDLHTALIDFRENDVNGIFSTVESVKLIDNNG